jgi:urease accessory protein UreH
VTVLTSQAALQIHPPADAQRPSNPPAVLRSQYVVEAEAELHCHWDPVIPFAGARLDQRFDLRIDESSRVYWSDAMMAGRVSRGEAWRFDSLAHELALRVGPSLTYLERYTLEPLCHSTERRWAAGAGRYFGTTLVHHHDVSSDIAERWHRAGACHPGVQTATDVAAPRLLVTRAVSADGAPFARARASYRAAALDDIFRAPELAGRK